MDLIYDFKLILSTNFSDFEFYYVKNYEKNLFKSYGHLLFTLSIQTNSETETLT